MLSLSLSLVGFEPTVPNPHTTSRAPLGFPHQSARVTYTARPPLPCLCLTDEPDVPDINDQRVHPSRIKPIGPKLAPRDPTNIQTAQWVLSLGTTVLFRAPEYDQCALDMKHVSHMHVGNSLMPFSRIASGCGLCTADLCPNSPLHLNLLTKHVQRGLRATCM